MVAQQPLPRPFSLLERGARWSVSFMCWGAVVWMDIGPTSDGPTISSGGSRGTMRGRARDLRAGANGSCCMRSGTTRAKRR